MGGYKLIDFKGLDLSNSENVGVGFYDNIYYSEKPLMISNLQNHKPCFATVSLPITYQAPMYLCFYVRNKSYTITITYGGEDGDTALIMEGTI